MTENTRRAAETRDKTQRRKPWAPPSRLDAPAPPTGYVHRWIRVAMRGEDDKINVHQKLREGWEPVRSDEYPDFDCPDDRRRSVRGCHRDWWSDAVPHT
jgi:hypothetical protein